MNFQIQGNPTQTGFNLKIIPRLEEETEFKKLTEIIAFLKNTFQLEVEEEVLQHVTPQYCKFKAIDGIFLVVALDDQMGLTVDCNSKRFLANLAPLIKKAVFPND
ncbi:MAG: hypothetical protein ABIQ95_01725 [Bdellovibrionia bacterium]